MTRGDDGDGGDLTRDAFLGGRLHLWQPRRGYRATVDPVLLAAFCPAAPGQRVLDLGCGFGAAALCLATRVPGLDLHGLELQAEYASLARRNAEANGVAMQVHEGDLRRPPAALRAMSFDLVLTNPPFHPQGNGSPAADAGRDCAFREGEAALEDWIAAALRRLAPGGALALVHLTPRLPQILAALHGRAGAIEILPLTGRASRPAERLLLRARKGSRAALTLHPPFALHSGDAHDRDAESYTEAAQNVLRGASGLLLAKRQGATKAGNTI